MILLDTNVITEFRKPTSEISTWLRKQDPREFRISVTTLTEVNYGLQRMSPGRNRYAAQDEWSTFVELMRDAILPVTRSISEMTGVVLATREALGRRVDFADAQIASTAIVHRCKLATRNTKDFEQLGIDLINPWGSSIA